jgi:hypothetical protein
MKQSRLVKELYKACIENDANKISELRKEEFKKIFNRKTNGKPFTRKWTVVKV